MKRLGPLRLPKPAYQWIFSCIECSMLHCFECSITDRTSRDMWRWGTRSTDLPYQRSCVGPFAFLCWPHLNILQSFRVLDAEIMSKMTKNNHFMLKPYPKREVSNLNLPLFKKFKYISVSMWMHVAQQYDAYGMGVRDLCNSMMPKFKFKF